MANNTRKVFVQEGPTSADNSQGLAKEGSQRFLKNQKSKSRRLMPESFRQLMNEARGDAKKDKLEKKKAPKEADGMHCLWYLDIKRFEHAHGKQNPVYWVAYAPNGKLFATAGHDKHCATWDSATFVNIRRYRGHSGPVLQCAFSPDSSQLVTVAERTFHIWEVSSGSEMIKMYEVHKDIINTIDWSSNGAMIATGSADKEIKIWNTSRMLGPPVPDRGLVLTLSTGSDGHTQAIQRVAFSPNSDMLLSASADWTLKMWSILKKGRLERTFLAHKDSVLGVSWNRDGTQFASASHDGTIILWEPHSNLPFKTLHQTGHVLYMAKYGPEGRRLLTVGHYPQIVMWNSKAGKKLNSIDIHKKGWTTCLAFSPNGKRFIVTSTEDKYAMIVYEAQGNFGRFWGAILWISRMLRILR